MKEHITTHLTGLPFPCERCDYSFETNDQLEEHQLKHAEMEYEEQIEKEVLKEALQNVDTKCSPHNIMEEDASQMTEYTIDDFSNQELSAVPRKKSNIIKVGQTKAKTAVNQAPNEFDQSTNQKPVHVEDHQPQTHHTHDKTSLIDERVHAGNYVPFLKDEVDSDVEEMGIPQEAIHQGTQTVPLKIVN